jgi:hypothetical protein
VCTQPTHPTHPTEPTHPTQLTLHTRTHARTTHTHTHLDLTAGLDLVLIARVADGAHLLENILKREGVVHGAVRITRVAHGAHQILERRVSNTLATH